MAAPSCAGCAAMGYRECDLCGGPVFVPGPLIDVCDNCRADGAAGSDSSGSEAAASGASGLPAAAPAPGGLVAWREWNTPGSGVGGAV